MSNTPPVCDFLHVRMRVNDLGKTVDFYQKILGCKEIKRSVSNRGSEIVFLKVPGSDVLLEITYYPDSGTVSVQEDLMHLAFRVESMSAFEAHIKSHGIGFSEAPQVSKGSGSTYAFIDAPEGYEIEIIEEAS